MANAFTALLVQWQVKENSYFLDMATSLWSIYPDTHCEPGPGRSLSLQLLILWIMLTLVVEMNKER